MKNRTHLMPALVALLATAATFLAGCASPAQTSSMVAAPIAVAAKHPEPLSVRVTGGSETSAAGASKISNADFAEAIRQSVEQSGLFAKAVLADPTADYHLDVNIVRLDQPMMGFSMTVTIEATWTLSKRDNTVVWQKSVTSTHTATTGEAFAGVTRLRLATEGAAKQNIQDALGQMGKASW